MWKCGWEALGGRRGRCWAACISKRLHFTGNKTAFCFVSVFLIFSSRQAPVTPSRCVCVLAALCVSPALSLLVYMRVLSRAGSSTLNMQVHYSAFFVVAKISSCCLWVPVVHFILNTTASSVPCLQGCALNTPVFGFLFVFPPLAVNVQRYILHFVRCVNKKLKKNNPKNSEINIVISHPVIIIISQPVPLGRDPQVESAGSPSRKWK